ncbi:Mobile element protein [Minicystis rosea]|nr:Mobile element protein [Minicystis rosea]APR87793.1 Mobile element protein [Minicystis rosea]
MATLWKPPVELSSLEKKIVERCGKRRVFVFLRELRHLIFDEEMQRKLHTAYERADRVPPVQLALASLLQAALGVPDHEVVELTVMDRRWQMVLGCLSAEEPLFSQGTLFYFRQRMIEHDLDRELFDRTVRLARETGGFSATHLRAAFDASPLWGAGRVEDTFNLIGRAAKHVVRTAAELTGRSFEEVAKDAGIPVVTATSIKTGLDIDWDDAGAKKRALEKLLAQVSALGAWMNKQLAEHLGAPPLKEQWELVEKLVAQDTEPDPDDGGGRRIKHGVAKDRRISVSDADMRHGRKSKKKRIDGYKRHIAVDLDTPGLVCAVALTPANQPERVAAAELFADIERQGADVHELFIDRGYLGDESIESHRRRGMAVRCKPFPLRNGALFSKADFTIDLDAGTVRCPNDVVVPFALGQTLHFPATRCAACPLRVRCTQAAGKRGRSLSVHPNEPFLVELRAHAKTPEGRATLRQRVGVEHALATIHNRQGVRARYRGLRRNLFDLRRQAALSNLCVADQLARVAA